MIEATCDLKHKFTIPTEREEEQASRCPTCGCLTWNPSRPKRKRIDIGVGAVIGDTDKWNPFCPNLGEMDRSKMAGRVRDGTLRKNPKTGCLEGYFDTHAKYRQALKDQGVMNSHGEGQINEDKQGWKQKPR